MRKTWIKMLKKWGHKEVLKNMRVMEMAIMGHGV